MSLKQKTVAGLTWSFIDNFAQQGLTFIIGIILARLLTPRDYGMIGMISIFIAISASVVNSGFGQALIRKKDCSQADYSTVFFYNLAVSIILFIILFVTADAISVFFNEPQLKLIIRVLSIGLIINAFSIIQRNILIKRVDFKLQTRISIVSSVFSGIIGISMAYLGYGVWSLIIKMLAGYFVSSMLLWLWNKWRPRMIISITSFKELFSFGYKLFLSGLLDTAYRNVYLVVIGKYFSASELGFYTRADQFNSLPSQNLTAVIQQVSYPVLASIQDETARLKQAYKKLVRSTMLISFVLMLGMAAIARPMVLALLGTKWLPSADYLQLLCFVGMLYPLHALNLNMLNVQGRSDLFLRLEIIKKIIAIPTIVIGIFFGIKIMIVTMFVNSLIAYYLNSYWSGKFIDYPIGEQIKDILPALVLAIVVNSLVFLAGFAVNLSPKVELILQISLGAILTIGFCEIIKLSDYLYIKKTIVEKFLTKK